MVTFQQRVIANNTKYIWLHRRQSVLQADQCYYRENEHMQICLCTVLI